MVAGMSFTTTAAAATVNNWICHGPVGQGNYVYVAPGSVNGHDRHDTDIIPPGLFGASGDAIYDSGQNWNPTTQVTYLPGTGGKTACQVPDGPVDTTTVSICRWQGDGSATWLQESILKSAAAAIAAAPTGNDAKDIIPSFDYTVMSGSTPSTTSVGLNSGEAGQLFDGTAILANGCIDAGAMIKVCVASTSDSAPYALTSIRFNALTGTSGTGIGEGAASKDGSGTYPTDGWGNIVPALAKSAFPYYLTASYPGVNATAGADWITSASCPTQVIPVVTTSPTPTASPSTSPSTSPTTIATPTPAVSAKGPGEVAVVVPVAEASPSTSVSAEAKETNAPVATPEPVVAEDPTAMPITPEPATVPTVVNAGGGMPGSQLPIWALAMAIVGAIITAGSTVRLATSRRTDIPT